MSRQGSDSAQDRPSPVAGLDREAAIAALLAVPANPPSESALSVLAGTSGSLYGSSDQRRRYREAILAPGDAVTIVGRALPFSDLADPTEADVAIGSDLAADDPEVLGDIAEARQAGLLERRPRRPGATPRSRASASASRCVRPSSTLRRTSCRSPPPAKRPRPSAGSRSHPTASSSRAPGVPLLIAHGVPGAAVERHEGRFLVGLLGAILAIASAMALALMLSPASGS